MKRTILHKLFAFAILIYVSFWCGAGVSAQSIKWTTRAITPVTGGSGRNGAMCFTINNKIYVGGGYIAPSVNTKSFYEYDTATNIWTQKADLPVAANRSAGVGFAIGGKGYIGLGSENYLDIGGGALVQTDMWEYNPTSNTWTAKASIPDTGRNNSGCFVINNKAYIIGGEKTIGISGSTTNDVWEFDPAANVWTPKASFPLGTIKSPFAFTLGSGSSAKGYISCGSVNSAVSKKTYSYDPVANTWTAKPDYPGSAVMGGLAFTMNNKAYCGLAALSFTVYTDTFYAYDAVTGNWGSAITTFPGVPRGFAVAASFGNKAFIGGGWTYASSGQTFYQDWYRVMDSSTTTGITSIQNSKDINIYPNPAKTMLNINPVNTGITTAEITFYDLLGREALTTKWEKGIPIDIAGLPAGQYVMKIITEENVYNNIIVVTD